MIIFGYAKNSYQGSDGMWHVQVRIPSVHGPFKQEDYRGKSVRNYVLDDKLPYYNSLELPRKPHDGDVVALASLNGTSSNFLVLGLTGGSYKSGYLV